MQELPPHPYVVKFLAETRDEDHHWLVLEWIKDGDLFQSQKRAALRCMTDTHDAAPAPVELATARAYFSQLVRRLRPTQRNGLMCLQTLALEHLHTCGVAHLDISLENILVVDSNRIKLCDLGIAHRMPCTASPDHECSEKDDGHLIHPTCLLGKPRYMAPEVYSRQTFCPVKADLYSLGMSLLIMLTASFPYHRPDPRDPSFRAVYGGQLGHLLELSNLQHLVPHSVMDLLGGLLCPPSRRWSLAQVQAHPFVRHAQTNLAVSESLAR